MTGESIFKKELSSYAQQYYDRVAGLHWNLQSSRPLPSGDTYMEDIPDDESEESESEDQMEEGLDESGSKDEVEEESSEKDKSGGDKDISSDDKDEPPKNKEEKKYGGDAILHKEFSGVHFLTNGYDYWFTNKVDLKKACVVTLMDYFNCLVDDVPFRKLSYVEVVEPENGEEKEDWREVLHRLSARKWKRAGGDHPTFATTKKLFLPTSGGFFFYFNASYFILFRFILFLFLSILLECQFSFNFILHFSCQKWSLLSGSSLARF